MAVVGNKRPSKGFKFQRRLFGKPTSDTYGFAERRLEVHRRTLCGGKEEPETSLKTVYMVGDNPASDIRGANVFESPSGTTWESILVKTGVYRSGTPNYEPKAIVPDITAAVQWALKKSSWEKPFL